MLTITEPTPVVVQLDWLRPSGTSRTDRIELLVTSQKPAGLVKDLQVNQNTYSLVAGDIIDPSDYTGALAPGGQRVTIAAYASYEFNAFYPACLCFRPTSWVYSTKLLLKAVNPGTAPTIGQQPANQSVLAGTSASFSVTAGGSGLRYQWQRAAPGSSTFVDLTGERAASLVTPATTAADNGARYRVRVCAAGASSPCVESNLALLTVYTAPVAPSFTLQPVSTSIVAGQTASFDVTVAGQPAPAVQWYRVGNPGDMAVGTPCPPGAAGATECHYTTAALQLADSGARFYARATNAAGQSDSNSATVTVQPQAVAPGIVHQPADQSVPAGSSASFTVEASGTAPLSYQWYRDGQPISGANGATLTFPNVGDTDNGATFHVVVSNDSGSVTSNPARLTVTAPVCIGPTQIDARTGSASFYAPVVIDASGRAMAVWSEWEDTPNGGWYMFASRFTPGTGWSAAARVAPLNEAGDLASVPVRLDAAGNVWAAWHHALGGVSIARYDQASGDWAVSSELSGNNKSGGEDLALAPNGEAMVVWSTGGQTETVYAKRFAGGAWSSSATQVSTVSPARNPRVAMDASGNAMAVWRQPPDGDNHLYASRYARDTNTWSVPVKIENEAGGASDDYQLAMNSAGQAAVVWSGAPAPNPVYIARYEPGSGWLGTETLDADPNRIFSLSSTPQVAITDDGVTVAIWSHYTEDRDRIYARTHAAGGWSGPPTVLSSANQTGHWEYPYLAMSPSGTAIVVSQQSEPDQFGVYINRFTPPNQWQVAEHVTSFDTQTHNAYGTRVAVNTNGAFAATWGQDGNGTWAIQCP
ncbi:MAG TPA: immunoglobulin domain-containing protein [Ottowia sp.]|uniref:immunoglobulin domain-containing protein n=1 Tax=Ottowia sp. TaxID=1898956 RepID=UPI002BD92262|nr:immunoglobulin domain-containing protein [Ottowia sp.]HMN22321.1 immunoglobulin domain-containing protein [Ottowia sp.]